MARYQPKRIYVSGARLRAAGTHVYTHARWTCLYASLYVHSDFDDADVHTDVYTDVCTGVYTDVYADVYTDVCTDVYTDVLQMSRQMSTQMSTHAAYGPIACRPMSY